MRSAVSTPSPRAALIVVIVSSIVMSLCMGLRQTLGLFLQPMSAVALFDRVVGASG
jgi:hypothetical protein